MSVQRLRGVVVGKAMFVRVIPDKGWGGAYGQQRRAAKWQCVDCGHMVRGDNERPYLRRRWGLGWSARFNDSCADNGHAPCRRCGKQLPRLNCGCPREHNVKWCPGKTPDDRVYPTHASNTPHRVEVSA